MLVHLDSTLFPVIDILWCMETTADELPQRKIFEEMLNVGSVTSTIKPCYISDTCCFSAFSNDRHALTRNIDIFFVVLKIKVMKCDMEQQTQTHYDTDSHTAPQVLPDYFWFWTHLDHLLLTFYNIYLELADNRPLPGFTMIRSNKTIIRDQCDAKQ